MTMPTGSAQITCTRPGNAEMTVLDSKERRLSSGSHGLDDVMHATVSVKREQRYYIVITMQ
ncbi:MAG TPA: hypothetical protein DDZ84_12840, partial [Firmicutes bacterium]|nr:hypothetical protein [Bacillota bacterium]